MVSLWLLKEVMNVNPGILAGTGRKNTLFHQSGHSDFEWFSIHAAFVIVFMRFCKGKQVPFEERYCIDFVSDKTRLLHRGWQTSIKQSLPTVRMQTEPSKEHWDFFRNLSCLSPQWHPPQSISVNKLLYPNLRQACKAKSLVPSN